jgi:hypothetical protein
VHGEGIGDLRGVDNRYIGKAIDDLAGFFGVREDIPVETLVYPLHKGDTKACIETMANHLGLPIRVELIGSDSFDSRDLVSTGDTGQGTEGITAQVFIPSDLPLYGSSGLEGFPVQVKVSGDCQRYALGFVATMAHELSHIVLHSVLHTERDNEIYTDIAAMLLGFATAMSRGRYAFETTNLGPCLQQTRRTRFGYLNDEQFAFALSKVRAIQKNSREALDTLRTAIYARLNKYKKQVDLFGNMFKEFNKLIKCLDRKQAKRIREEDARKIVEIHSLNYGDRFLSVLRSSEKKLEEIELLYTGWFEKHQGHYSKQKLKSLEGFYSDLGSLLSGLEGESVVLRDDVAVMRRCFSFFDRVRINREVRSGG